MWDPKESDIEWTRNLFRSLKENGTWVIPATGQVFVKKGNKLTLIASNHMETDVYRSEEAQADMFNKVSVIGAKIGIEVDKL